MRASMCPNVAMFSYLHLQFTDCHSLVDNDHTVGIWVTDDDTVEQELVLVGGHLVGVECRLWP